MHTMSCVHQLLLLLASLFLLTSVAAAATSAAAGSKPQLKPAGDDEETISLPQLKYATVTGCLRSPVNFATNLFNQPNKDVAIGTAVEFVYLTTTAPNVGNTVDITPSAAVTFTYFADAAVFRPAFEVELMSAAFAKFEDFLHEKKDSFPDDMKLTVVKKGDTVTIKGDTFTAGRCGATFKYSFQMQPEGGCVPDPSRPCCGHDFKYLGANHICRHAVGKCDVPEYCIEHCSECPKNELAHNGDPCHALYQVPYHPKKSYYHNPYENSHDSYEKSYNEEPHYHHHREPYRAHDNRPNYDRPYRKTGPYAVDSPTTATKEVSAIAAGAAAGDPNTVLSEATVLSGSGDKATTEGYYRYHQHQESPFYVECSGKCHYGECVLTPEDKHKCW